MDVDEKNKRVQNLFISLQNDPKSVFYTTNKITKSLLKKAKMATYNKDDVFVKLYEQIEDKKFYKNENLPLVTPYIDKKSNIDHSMLYSISRPFEALHADIADLRFLAKSAVDPKYCLLIVNLFTSKIYVYPMKNRSLLAKKMEIFYDNIQPKRTGKMHLQTDLEFNQSKIKALNKKFDVEMFHTKIRGGKAFAAEQKIREFKKILLRSKRFEKMKKKKKKNRIRPNQFIENTAENMNITVSAKYGTAPENIEHKSLDPKDRKSFQEVYDFMRLKNIQNNEMRFDKYNQRIDRRKKTLRSPLNIGEKVLVLAERLKKKMRLENFLKV